MYYLADPENPQMLKSIKLEQLRRSHSRKVALKKNFPDFSDFVIEKVCEVFEKNQDKYMKTELNPIDQVYFNKGEALSKTRIQHYVIARQAMVYIMRLFTYNEGKNRVPLALIGKSINIDHATVIHSVKRVEIILDYGYEPWSSIISECIKEVEMEWVKLIKKSYANSISQV